MNPPKRFPSKDKTHVMENKAIVIQLDGDLFGIIASSTSYNDKSAYLTNTMNHMDKMKVGLRPDFVDVITRLSQANYNRTHVCWERRNMDPGLNPSGRLVRPVIRTYTRHFWRSPREPEEQSY